MSGRSVAEPPLRRHSAGTARAQPPPSRPADRSAGAAAPSPGQRCRPAPPAALSHRIPGAHGRGGAGAGLTCGVQHGQRARHGGGGRRGHHLPRAPRPAPLRSVPPALPGARRVGAGPGRGERRCPRPGEPGRTTGAAPAALGGSADRIFACAAVSCLIRCVSYSCLSLTVTSGFLLGQFDTWWRSEFSQTFLSAFFFPLKNVFMYKNQK